MPHRPPSTNLPKKERDERRHAKAGGGVATALAGTQTFSAQRVPVAAGSGRGGGGGGRDAAPRLQSGTVSAGRCVGPLAGIGWNVMTPFISCWMSYPLCEMFITSSVVVFQPKSMLNLLQGALPWYICHVHVHECHLASDASSLLGGSGRLASC